MRLPSGTRMSLLLAFAFVLITSEFPEFRSRGRLGKLLLKEQQQQPSEAMNVIEGASGGDYEAAGEAETAGDQSEAEVPRLLLMPPANSRMSIFVEATFFHKKHHYRKWGCGGCGGYRRMHYGHHHHYRRHHYGGCNVCGKRK